MYRSLVITEMISDRPTFHAAPPPSNDRSLLQIIDLIADTLGFHVHLKHQDSLRKTILTRIDALGLASFNDYYLYLITQSRSLCGATEWHRLVELLSVTESYFFRDQGQFWLLKNQLLPELISRKRQLSLMHADTTNEKPHRPTLRLWSAGCSTGEEAYSLAILIKELIPDYQAWDILILGTDINQSAIAIAQQGIYNDWSFRTTEPTIKNYYFRPHRKSWEIDPSIRQMVTFQFGNLVQDPYPDYNSKIHNLDLILCRNVFIYFNFNTIARILEKFYRSLAPGGVLLSGHTELHGQNTQSFLIKSFPQSIVYQREFSLPILSHLTNTAAQKAPSGQKAVPTHPLPTQDSKSHPDISPTVTQPSSHSALLDQARRSLRQEAYTDTIQVAQHLVKLAPQHFQAYCLLAEAHANLGQYTQATEACQQALQINALATEPYYLLAQIAEEQGDIDSAKLFLKRIIYLTPNAVSAYQELGSIYEREGNAKQAQKTWRSLLEVLQGLPQEQPVNTNNRQTVADLREYLSHYRQV